MNLNYKLNKEYENIWFISHGIGNNNTSFRDMASFSITMGCDNCGIYYVACRNRNLVGRKFYMIEVFSPLVEILGHIKLYLSAH